MKKETEYTTLHALKDLVEAMDDDAAAMTSMDKALLLKVVGAITGAKMPDITPTVENDDNEELDYMNIDLDEIREHRTVEATKVEKVIAKLIKLDAMRYYGSSDSGLAQLYSDLYPIHRYNSTAKTFWMYDGTRWIPDNEGLAARQDLKIMCKALLQYADGTEAEKYQKSISRLGSCNKRNNVLTDIKDNSAFTTAELDKNDYLINVQNGTLDLSGDKPVLLKHHPNMLVSKICDVQYNPDAEAEEWKKFINEVMMGNESKTRYLQKVAGMALTGDTREEKMFILYGPLTRNGKSTFCEVLCRLIGDYAVSMRPESLAQRANVDSRQASGDIARLAGVRYCSVAEPRKRMVLDAGIVKNLTGGDGITARHLHEREFTFIPKMTILMNTNHLPIISDETLFSSGRLVVIEFPRHFEEDEQDKTLKGRLCSPESLSGILNWCIEGWFLYRKEGLEPPQSIIEATAQYREESDKIGAFITECLDKNEGTNTAGKDAYVAYARWCQDAGFGTENKNNFFAELKNKGIFRTSGTINGQTVRNIIAGYTIRREWSPTPSSMLDPSRLPRNEVSPWDKASPTPAAKQMELPFNR